MDLFDVVIARKLSGGGGGGGSSDFTTAYITTDGSSGIEGAFVSSIPVFDPPIEATLPASNFGTELILYKGKALIHLFQTPYSINGNIQDLGDLMYMVTGDCEIYFTNPA